MSLPSLGSKKIKNLIGVLGHVEYHKAVTPIPWG